MNKVCKICNIIKNISEFRMRKRNNKIHYESYCIICEKEDKKRRWHNTSSEKKKQYRLNRREKNIEYEKNRKKKDINFYLKKRVSHSIYIYLNNQKLSKNGKSILEYLPYSIKELKDHLESLFEPWMNWDNHGIYKVDEWDDNDQTTWKWQIDHIIPHSFFKYTSMEDEEFKKCWDLNNLQPLSAKQNLFKGARK